MTIEMVTVRPTPTEISAEISATADEVADLVEKGWCRGTAYVGINPDQPRMVCLGYAINTIVRRRTGSELEVAPIWVAFENTINGNVTYGRWHLVAWNDAEGRKQQEVVDLARKVAKDYQIKADEEALCEPAC